MSTLAERAEAAIELIRRGDLDPVEGLALVIWPTQALKDTRATPKYVSDEEAERMAAMVAAGMSHKKIGERLGRPRTTVTAVLRRTQCQLTLDK